MLIFFLAGAVLAEAALPWPKPRQVTATGGRVRGISKDVVIALFGAKSNVVDSAVMRTKRWTNHSRIRNGIALIEIFYGSDESLDSETSYDYNLTVGENASRIVAESPYGVVYALDSLWQTTETCRIVDRPLKKHRGLLVDVARHFLPLPLLRRTVVAMSFVKLNVLHLHLTDSQSFPVQLDTVPELARFGAFSPQQTYSSRDLRELVKLARLFGVRVVPEIDVPAHTKSWGFSHPDLIVNCSTTSTSAATPSDIPALNPTLEETYRLVEKVMTEVASIFPDERLHFGCDEMRFKCWSERLPGDPNAYFDTFVTRLMKIAQSLGKKPIVWQEALEASSSLLASASSTVETWKCWSGMHERAAQDALRRNLRVVDASCWYLDWPSTTQDFASKKLLTRWEEFEGGEAAMWTENVDHSNFECRVWPRAAVVAQTLWSGPLVDQKPSMMLLRKRLRVRHAEVPFSFCPQLDQFQSPRKPPTPPELLYVQIASTFSHFPDSSDTVFCAFYDQSNSLHKATQDRNHGSTVFQQKAAMAGYAYTASLAAANLFVAAVAPIISLGPQVYECAGLRIDLNRRLNDPLIVTATTARISFGNVTSASPEFYRLQWHAHPDGGGEPPSMMSASPFEFFERQDAHERGSHFWRHRRIRASY